MPTRSITIKKTGVSSVSIVHRPGYYVFQPANDDPKEYSLTDGKEMIQHNFFPHLSKDTEKEKKSRDLFNHLNSMADLSAVDPAVLVIFGHGNMGAGIGSHKTKYNAYGLVQKLLKNGLNKKQKNLTIYLWACNTGARYLQYKKPYAQRFADSLNKAGFSGIRVVGIAGFISGTGHCTRLRMKINAFTKYPTYVDENPEVPPTDSSRHVLFDVNNGKVTYKHFENPNWVCKKVEGGYTTFKMCSTKNIDLSQVATLEIKNEKLGCNVIGEGETDEKDDVFWT